MITIENLKAQTSFVRDVRSFISGSDQAVYEAELRKLDHVPTEEEKQALKAKATEKSQKEGLEVYLQAVVKDLALIESKCESLVLEDNGVLRVRTHPIILHGKYDIGSYHIRIALNNSNKISIANALVEKGDDGSFYASDYHHPHIKDGGKGICWGNQGEIVTTYAAQHKFPYVVFRIISFLQTHNKDSVFINLTKWYPMVAYLKKYSK